MRNYRCMYCPSHNKVFWMDSKEGSIRPTPGHLGWAVKKYLGQQRLPRGFKMDAFPLGTQVVQLDRAGNKIGNEPPPTLPREVEPAVQPEESTPREEVEPPREPTGKVESAILDLMQELQNSSINEEHVREIVKQEIAARVTEPVTVEITRPDREPIKIDGAHQALPDVLSILNAGENVMLVGPSGCGKTFLAKQAAEAMEAPYLYVPQCNMGYDLLGFQNVDGYHTTPFRQGFEHGGLILCDEMDGWNESAALAFNGATANGYATFPDSPEPVHRNEETYILAAANTWGHGADREYVGRNQMDAATLDRFIPIPLDYDLSVEQALAGPQVDWLTQVWTVRNRCKDLKLRHVVSTRAVVRGRKLLEGGMPKTKVAELVLKRNLSQDDWRRVSE